MNKRLLIFILVVCGAALVAVYYYLFFKSHTHVTLPPANKVRPQEVQTFQGRRVLNHPPQVTQAKIPDIKVSNKISADWEEHLEAALRNQGGERLKEVKIEKIESIIWTINDHYINAESVRITLTDQNGALTKFRAIIDSESGQVLEVWDRPMVENIKRLPE